MKSKILILLFAAIYFSSCTKDSLAPVNSQSLNSQNLLATTTATSQSGNTQNKLEYMRVQLFEDSTTTDQTLLIFKPGAQTAYLKTEDAIYFQGFGAVSLSSESSDNTPLAINTLPLPKTSETIGLNVNVQSDGVYQLNLTALGNIPSLFEIWLMDGYKKDSLDFRDNPTYAFNVYKSDAASFGSNRFSIVIKQNPALGIHLLNFTAAKATGGAQITWLTENESNYTNFTVQRSTDNGKTYTDLTNLMSAGSGTYSFLDKSPANGTDQYRLEIQDLNGTITYSSAIKLTY